MGASLDRQARFVLGAIDPEMREIARVLRRADRGILRATRDGMLVLPRTAYEANGVLAHTKKGLERTLVLPGEPLVFVECTLRGHEPVRRVDHHHPGDPGYEQPPERYLQGASIGQTLALLEMEPTDTQRLLAAADHCLTAAYQGECPGVDPDELLFMRAAWRARVTGRGLADVIDGIIGAAQRVRQLHDSELGESLFLDPTEVGPDLAEGAAYAGRPVRYRELFPGGELKEMLKGASPEHIERFMAGHRAAGRETYGNPYRGYAGAYIQ